MKLSEAQQLKTKALAYGVKVGVEYTQTFYMTMGLIKTALEGIGTVRHIEMATKHLGRFTGYNVYWLLASHHLSILDMFYRLDKFKSRLCLKHLKKHYTVSS